MVTAPEELSEPVDPLGSIDLATESLIALFPHYSTWIPEGFIIYLFSVFASVIIGLYMCGYVHVRTGALKLLIA